MVYFQKSKRLIQVICMRGVVMHRDDQAVSPVIATVLFACHHCSTFEYGFRYDVHYTRHCGKG